MFEKVTSTKNILLLALVALTTTTTHTQAQENNWRICEHQPDGTVFPLYGACNSYVYCVGGNPFSLPCPPFMGFSKTVLACVIYSNSDCVEQTTTTTSPPIYSSMENPVTIATTLTTQGYCDNEQRHENQLACLGQVFGDLVPYPGSCTKFLVCICEYPVVSICPPGKWFDGKLKICNSPANVKCGDNQGTSVPSEEVTTPITFSTTESNDWGKDCIAPDGISPDICLNYDNGVLLNDPYNCSAYINCYMGCPIISYCEDNKVFNNVLKICDTNETVQCQELPMPRTTTTTTEASSSTSTQKSIFTTNEPSEENSTSLTTTPTDDCIAPLGMYADICANHAQDSFLAYPYNCTAFIICIWECPYLVYCENGKIFNDILGICDTPESMQCKELSHPTPGTPNSTMSTATSSSTTTELPFSTTLPPDVNPDLCWNQANYTTYPYATDCSKYLQCLNNKIRVHSCPNGWLFNSQLMLCDKTSEDFCYMAGNTSEKTLLRYATTEADDFDSCMGQLSGTTFPDIKNCSMYYLCMGNDSYYKLSCPTDNYYDIQMGHCGPEELVSPTGCLGEITTTASTVQPTTVQLITSTEPDLPSQGICGDYSNGELIPYPNNCQKYISCVRPIPVAFYCNNNWYFDVEQQKCIPDSQGICSESPANTTTTIKPPTYICQNLLLGDWQLYPGDCRFYYECLGDGYFMLKMCIEGEYFDPLIGQCSSQVNEEYCMQNFDTTTQATTTAKPSGICDEQPLGSKVPYPDNCFKYIVCDAPIPEGFNCPLYLQFSLAQQACVEPIESDCGIITTPTTTTLGPPTMPYNQCSNKPEFTLLPYPKDCGMFIICIQELEHLAFCLKNQYFDALQGECIDGASEDACRVEETTTTSGDLTTLELSTTTDITTSMDYSTQDPTSTEATTSQDPDSTTSMDYSTQDQSSTEATTTQDPDLGPCYGKPEGTKIPYPNNCTKYIECQDPLPLGHNCPVGLEFSVAFEECVIPELADCSTNTNPTTIPNTTTDTTDPTTEQITSTETSRPTTVNTEDSCENKPNGSTLTYPEDCSKYYVCINGKSKLTNCMLNTYYDSLSGQCYADISPTACQESTTSSPTTTPSSEETCENKPNGFTLPYPEDCSKYYNCLNGYSILTKCMLNTYYDPLSGECYGDISPTACQLLTTTSSPTVPTTISQTTENIGTDSTEHVSTETSNTPTTQPTEIPITSETPITTTENASSETSESTSPTTTAEIITTTDSEETCENKPNGSTLPYPSDCSKYYTCINGNSKLTTCMPYTYFDPSSGMCDSDISPTACLEISTTIPTTISQTTESITTESTVTSESSIPTTENVTKETSETTNTPTRATTEYISTETSITTNTPIITESSTDTTLDPATTSTEATTLSTLNPETTVTPDPLTSDPTTTADPTTLDPTTLHTSTTTISLTTENIGTDTTEHVSTETSNTPTTQTTENPITSETPITTSENVSTETSETTSPTTIAGIITTPDSEETCENKPNGLTLPYPSDCSKYYTCINGNSKLTTCMPYTYFDPSSGMCDSDISPTACLEISTTIATTMSQTTESILTESTITSESSIPTTENVTKDTSEATNAPTTATTEYISTETSITTTTPITTIITEASTLSTLDPATTFTTETTTLSTLHPETTVTPDPTTQDPTTLSPTTPDPLTSDPATQDPTTLDPTTLNTTTEDPTTLNHFTDPTTQDPTTLKPTTLEPTTLEPTTQDPTTFDPTTLDPTTLEHTTQDPSTQDPSTQDPTTLNPTTPDPTTQDPTTLKPTTLEPTTLDPTTFDPTTLHPTTQDPTTSTSTSPYEDICRGQINGTRLPYPGDNTKYIICQYPLPLEKQCPQNSEFDIKTKTCQTVGESTTYAPPNCSLYSSGHVMVYEGDCSKYYFCFASDAVALDCSQGWYFNPSLKQCVPKAYYSCPW